MLSDYFKDRFDGFNLFHGKSFMFSEVKPADVTTNFYSDYQTIKGYKALIDSATGQPYSVVRDTYQPINNSVITENMAQLINQKGLIPHITAYEYNNGSAMAVRYQFKEKGRDIQQGPNSTKKTFL